MPASSVLAGDDEAVRRRVQGEQQHAASTIMHATKPEGNRHDRNRCEGVDAREDRRAGGHRRRVHERAAADRERRVEERASEGIAERDRRRYRRKQIGA